VIVGGFLIFSKKAPVSQVQQPVVFPSSTSTTTSISTAQSNFLAKPDVHEDSYNPGYYYVGYQPTDASAPYLIRYIADTNYFTIGIVSEPIGASRAKAESYLMQLLGVTKEQMCTLNYAVYVSNDVNSQYSGTNLGFSFCPGAVQLPY
ncbi:MAG TPA: hypothetical protein VN086_03325, partial [Candidatus Paceibacterota bacterium]|nr:hypothetical protein [Candidatus Paceibacterota bacterium]